MRMLICVYVLNMLQLERLHAQCYPPLEKRKMVIIKDQSPYLSAFQFEKHDTIVSIGAGMMWREAQFSVLTDSLVFYIEDIDTLCAKIRE